MKGVCIAAHGSDYVNACLKSVMHHASPETMVVVVNGEGYDTGKYVRAFQQVPEISEWCFIHDSLMVTDSTFFSDGFAFVGDEVRALSTFDMARHPAERHMGINTTSPVGIFGPMFFCRSYQMAEVIGRVPKVANKKEQESMERHWASLFHDAGYPIVSIWGLTPTSTEDLNQSTKPFVKIFPKRT